MRPRCSWLLVTAPAAAAVAVAVAPGAQGGVSAIPVPSFTESASALGVGEAAGVETWSVAVSDWNGDGCDDLYVGRHRVRPPRLYANPCTGAFSDETWRLHLERLDLRTTWDRHGATFADLDGDGRSDLTVITGGDRASREGDADQLFRQLGSGEFEDAMQPDMQDRFGSGRFATVLDANGDGRLDVFVGHFFRAAQPDANRDALWEQDASGAFTNQAAAAGVALQETADAGTVADLNGDGRPDLVTLPGRDGTVFWNVGDGTFRVGSLGVKNAASASAGDYDGDGAPDLFVSRGVSQAANVPAVLLRNDGTGRFSDVTAQAGLAGLTHAESALWIDANDDGVLDLFVVRGTDHAGVNFPDVLALGAGDGTFTRVAAGVSGPTDGSHQSQDSAAWGDFNRDGAVDLALVTSESATPVRVYLNTPNANHWLALHLLDAGSANRQGLGATIVVRAGGRTQTRQVFPTTAAKSQSPPYALVGIGGARRASVTVSWPGGASSTAAGVRADASYELHPDGSIRVIP